MSDKVLLREYYALCEGGYCQDLLTEAEKKDIKENKAWYLTGILQRGNTKNGNGRKYPSHVLEREMKNYDMLIKQKRAYGELDHPDTSVVDLKNASHMVTRYWKDGDAIMGAIKILDTPCGEIVKGIVKSGGQVGISSRGLGSVVNESNGVSIVQEDFTLICFDIVADPSTPGAFMNPQKIRESKEVKVHDRDYRVNSILNSILD
tara:strand:+ start:4950 stop:5564 length:615 start_codon:yes stop_codon:yes gene_type:complete